jgi:hypothetical protein
MKHNVELWPTAKPVAGALRDFLNSNPPPDDATIEVVIDGPACDYAGMLTSVRWYVDDDGRAHLKLCIEQGEEL